MSPCPEPMSPSLKKQRVQSSNCLDLSCIQTVNLKAESKTLYNIDTDEKPGFLQSRKFGIR